MKKFSLAFLLACVLLLAMGITAHADSTVAINAANFPDSNFRAYISDIWDGDKNGILDGDEISLAVGLDVRSADITTMQGIEYLTALRELHADNMTELSGTLDLTQNTLLELVSLSRCPNLADVNLGSKANLYSLITNNSTSLHSMTLGSCPQLRVLGAYNTALTALNISGCPLVLNLLDDQYYRFENGAHVYEESPRHDGHNFWYDPDTMLNFGSVVPIIAGVFPDDYFRQYVRETWDTNGSGSLDFNEIAAADMIILSIFDDHWIENGMVTQAQADEVRSRWQPNITSLEGIQYFSGLKHLFASDMPKMSGSLDFSYNTELVTLHISNAGLTDITLGSLPKLESFRCHENRLSAVDLSGCPALKDIYVMRLGLTELDLSNNPNLEFVHCNDNALTGLDLSNNPNLERLGCANNRLSSLDLGGQKNLTYLNVMDNNLTALDVSGNSRLEELWCGSNSLTVLDLGRNLLLKKLGCENNQLTSLSVNQLSDLVFLRAGANQLTALDVSALSELEELYCYRNELGALDLRGCPKLKYLQCMRCALTELDISSCPLLVECYSHNNQLGELNVGTKNELRILSVYGSTMPVLDISGCPKLLNLVRENDYHEDGDECWYGPDEDNAPVLQYSKAILLKTSADQKIGILRLPASVTKVETEAFSGIDADIVVLPQGCETVESRAFADSPSLKIVHVPQNTTVAADAFDGCSVYINTVA